VMTIAKGLGLSMSELLADIEKQVEPSKRRSSPTKR